MKISAFLVFTLGVAIPIIAIPADKANLIDAVTEETGIDREDVQNIVEVFLENIKQHLANGEEVSLADFGEFRVRKRAMRSGRNPKTGESIQSPSSKIPTFKAAKAFREAVNTEALNKD